MDELQKKDIERRMAKYKKPVDIREKFLPTYSMGPEPELDAVQIIPVNPRLRESESVPIPQKGFLDKLRDKLR